MRVKAIDELCGHAFSASVIWGSTNNWTKDLKPSARVWPQTEGLRRRSPLRRRRWDEEKPEAAPSLRRAREIFRDAQRGPERDKLKPSRPESRSGPCSMFDIIWGARGGIGRGAVRPTHGRLVGGPKLEPILAIKASARSHSKPVFEPHTRLRRPKSLCPRRGICAWRRLRLRPAVVERSRGAADTAVGTSASDARSLAARHRGSRRAAAKYAFGRQRRRPFPLLTGPSI